MLDHRGPRRLGRRFRPGLVRWVTGRFRRRVRVGQVLARDPDHGQRDDRRQRQDARRDQVASGRTRSPARGSYTWVCSAAALARGDVEAGLRRVRLPGIAGRGHRAPGHGAQDCQPDRAADLLPDVEQAGGRAGVAVGPWSRRPGPSARTAGPGLPRSRGSGRAARRRSGCAR